MSMFIKEVDIISEAGCIIIFFNIGPSRLCGSRHAASRLRTYRAKVQILPLAWLCVCFVYRSDEMNNIISIFFNIIKKNAVILQKNS